MYFIGGGSYTIFENDSWWYGWIYVQETAELVLSGHLDMQYNNNII